MVQNGERDPARSEQPYPFSLEVLDHVEQEVVVVGSDGKIRYANRAWRDFATNHGCAWTAWCGVNYLRVCDRAAAAGDAAAAAAAHGIRDVLADRREEFAFEYACRAGEHVSWFPLRASACMEGGELIALIEHHDITRCVAAEGEVRALSRQDALTGIANRPAFEEALTLEWRRCLRARAPVSVAVADLDGLTHVNETYGHTRGDDYLVRVAESIQEHANRASDLAARFGPASFALLLRNTAEDDARHVAEHLRRAVSGQRLPNTGSHRRRLTLSIGVATAWPNKRLSPAELIGKAEALRYAAKWQGRDQVRSGRVEAGMS